MLIAVCDDESEIRQMLADKIWKIYPGADLDFYQSGEELLEGTKVPDILFLDIRMSGRNGMETAEEFRKKHKKTALIFVTAAEEYVFQAFDVGAFHYLVKPFTDKKFEDVLKSAAAWCKEQENVWYEKEQEAKKDCIIIKTGGVHTKVMIRDIVYAEVFNRKITIHKTDGALEYYGKMSELEKQAGEDFFRSHRAYLVHFKYIVRYDASNIYLEGGRVLMSKGKYKDFVKQYLKYNKRYAKEHR